MDTRVNNFLNTHLQKEATIIDYPDVEILIINGLNWLKFWVTHQWYHQPMFQFIKWSHSSNMLEWSQII